MDNSQSILRPLYIFQDAETGHNNPRYYSQILFRVGRSGKSRNASLFSFRNFQISNSSRSNLILELLHVRTNFVIRDAKVEWLIRGLWLAELSKQFSKRGINDRERWACISANRITSHENWREREREHEFLLFEINWIFKPPLFNYTRSTVRNYERPFVL